ncbi:UNVERIFIED_CONTAM: hypothetical protein GTU68_032019, partial [Idotea baltica]|nr:hypothetical protein [Idotea baltica]
MSLDLVKNRVGVMGVEMRKAFIGQILVGLIEKTPEAKVMKAITKIVEEWVKNKSPIAINQGPSVREKSILLVKLMQYVEKRFAEDSELMGIFLELINYVYRDDVFKSSELTSKLEPAFLSGLRSSQPHIRAKFFQVFNESMTSKLYDRLLYIVCSQNWENMGPHYWIKQCIELLMVTAKEGIPIQNCWSQNLLPSFTSIIGWADAADRANFSIFASLKDDPSEETLLEANSEKEVDIEMELPSVPTDGQPIEANSQGNPQDKLNNLLHHQNTFLKKTKDLTSSQFLNAMSQLAHMDTSLAEWIWLQFFPKIWKILTDRQQQSLSNEMLAFICYGAHVIQKDCHPSALNTFVEALTQCHPPITIKPNIMKYLGKSHNLWYRMTLMLEQAAHTHGALNVPRGNRRDFEMSESEPINSPQQDII